MNRTCKTCKHWRYVAPGDKSAPLEFRGCYVDDVCRPIDPDTFKPMQRGFETRVCMLPSQGRFEPPSESNGFSLTDASLYFAALCTGEDFGCLRHESL